MYVQRMVVKISPQDTLITAYITKRCFGEDSIDAEEHIESILIYEIGSTL